jgi:hypothetical protein
MAESKKPAPKAKAAAPKAAVYKVAEGKALTSKKGILGPGSEVKAEDLPGGDEALQGLVKSKHVVKG